MNPSARGRRRVARRALHALVAVTAAALTFLPLTHAEATPVGTELQVLQSPTGADNSNFGNSLAASSALLVVGSSGESVNGLGNAGAVYVYPKLAGSGGYGTPVRVVAPDAQPNGTFGLSVAVSNTTIVVGTNLQHNPSGGNGAVYVFTQQGPGKWVLADELFSPNSNDTFGLQVAISGTRIAVLAPGYMAPGSSDPTGVVDIYDKTTTGWGPAPTAQVFGSQEQAPNFGPLSLSGDTLAVGSTGTTVNGNASQGEVLVYTDGSSGWQRDAVLTSSDGAPHDDFGDSVSVTGSLLAVGAFGKNQGVGESYIFKQAHGKWIQQAALPPLGDAEAQGDRVATSKDLVLSAAPITAGGGTAYLYAKNGSQWALQASLTPSGGPTPVFFGSGVISGNLAIIADEASGNGVVYVFQAA